MFVAVIANVFRQFFETESKLFGKANCLEKWAESNLKLAFFTVSRWQFFNPLKCN